MAPSFAPEFDPEKVEEVTISREIDRDFVGSQEVGKLGNNREVFVLRSIGKASGTLYSVTFDTWKEADEHREFILRKLQANQRELF